MITYDTLVGIRLLFLLVVIFNLFLYVIAFIFFQIIKQSKFKLINNNLKINEKVKYIPKSQSPKDSLLEPYFNLEIKYIAVLFFSMNYMLFDITFSEENFEYRLSLWGYTFIFFIVCLIIFQLFKKYKFIEIILFIFTAPVYAFFNFFTFGFLTLIGLFYWWKQAKTVVQSENLSLYIFTLKNETIKNVVHDESNRNEILNVMKDSLKFIKKRVLAENFELDEINKQVIENIDENQLENINTNLALDFLLNFKSLYFIIQDEEKLNETSIKLRNFEKLLESDVFRIDYINPEEIIEEDVIAEFNTLAEKILSANK